MDVSLYSKKSQTSYIYIDMLDYKRINIQKCKHEW